MSSRALRRLRSQQGQPWRGTCSCTSQGGRRSPDQEYLENWHDVAILSARFLY